MDIEEARKVIKNIEIDVTEISCKDCVLDNRKSCILNRQRLSNRSNRNSFIRTRKER